jgi:hypothetical protein
MNNTLRIQLAAAAALLAVAPVAASAEQTAYTASPVAIRTVTNEHTFFAIPSGPQRLYIDGVSVSFVNNENVAATRVEFAVDRDGAVKTFAAKGNYAPGTSITTNLANDTSIESTPSATVSVAKVDFADGTTWTAATGRVASTTLEQTAAR